MNRFGFFLTIFLFLMAGGGSAQSMKGAPLSKEVEILIDGRMGVLEREVAGNAIIINEVRRYNEKNKGVSAGEIAKMDAQWRASETELTESMREFLTGPGAEFLIAFQESHEGYIEVFLTDIKGLTIAMTNKTSDYLQSDEDWWVSGYANGQGHAYHTSIEYDESSMSESIAIIVPVKDPESGLAIGIIKAVIDIMTIQMELE